MIIKIKKTTLRQSNTIMERNDLLKELNDIFVDTLDNEDLIIEESTIASDVEEWDSLTHIMLVVAIEKHFKIKFTSKEILSWQNVGEMMTAILNK